MGTWQRSLLTIWLCATAPAQAQPSDTAALAQLIREEAITYENGEGVERDSQRAITLYCQAARLGDAQAQYNLGWMYSTGRGIERSDTTAAFFFHAAAEQGLPQAIQMLDTVGGPSTELPPCMQSSVLPDIKRSWSSQVTSTSKAPAHLVGLVERTAAQYRVAPQLVLAIMEVESNFNVAALSPKNAQGLMQLMPQTAARFNVTRPFDAAQNTRGGTAYLRWLLAYFEGNVALVAAAYNAGEGAVNRYRGVPPYAETLTYVSRVLKRVGTTTLPFDRQVTTPSPQIRSMRF